MATVESESELYTGFRTNSETSTHSPMNLPSYPATAMQAWRVKTTNVLISSQCVTHKYITDYYFFNKEAII